MADSTLNAFVASGTTAERTAFTPTPPTPASGPDSGYTWWDTDDQALYAYDFGTAAWVATGGGTGTVTHTGTLTADGLVLGNGGSDIKPLAMGTAGQVPTVNAGATAVAFATPAMVKIDEQTPSGTGVVTFSSLGNFTHLKILCSGRGTQVATSTTVGLTFNGDTGANYDVELLSASGSTPTAGENVASTSAPIVVFPAASAPANGSGSFDITIHDYRNTTFEKNGEMVGGWKLANSSGNLQIRARWFAWRSTAAITSITFTLVSGNYVAGTKFTLYGLN